MAEGGREEERKNHPLGPRGMSGDHPEGHKLTRVDVGNQGRFLLTRFIHDRMAANGIANTPAAESLVEPGTPSGPPVEHIHEVADALKKIGDELDGDHDLQKLIEQITPDSPRKTFQNVAREIFKDGTFNWGRIVALFYFGFKMAVKAMESLLDQVPVIRGIVEWIIEFIIDFVAPWILDRGGWGAIMEYFGTPTVQTAAVLISGLTCCALVYLSKS